MDIRAQQAREHHRESDRLGEQAAQHRQQRDELIRGLRADDPAAWTYEALAKAVGCSPELIAHVVKRGRRRLYRPGTMGGRDIG